jgi:hypothetical protein
LRAAKGRLWEDSEEGFARALLGSSGAVRQLDYADPGLDNPLLVAQEDGHSVETMLRTYAAWIKGAKSEDIERIKRAMASRPSTDGVGDESGARGPLESQKNGHHLATRGAN